MLSGFKINSWYYVFRGGIIHRGCLVYECMVVASSVWVKACLGNKYPRINTAYVSVGES